ncbi:MAG: glutamine amidotransferase [Nocardioides sp.]|nr:glutamine amidotransferase [Nocardioides sp.]
MRPFLLLSIRAEQAAADEEHAAFARFLGVEQDDVERRQLGSDDVSDVPGRLDDWSGVVLGGGAFTWSDEPASKSPAQQRAEAGLTLVLDAVVAADFPSSAPATASAPSAATRAASSTAPTPSQSGRCRSR